MSAAIIVVEDEGIIAMNLQDMLEDFGYRVPAIAATAAEALQAITDHHPDLLLLDIHLAGGDNGIALAERVRAEYDLPIVFLTAHSDAQTVARARETAPFHFLLKPFNEREVQIAVDLALARSQSERQLRASERRFATTLSSLIEGVVVTDRASLITYLNPAAGQITGWPPSDALGRPLDEVVQAEASGRPLSALAAQSMQWARPLSLPADTMLIRRDGAQRQIANSIAPLTDERGRVGGAVLVLQDVTEQRRADEERQQVERKLLEAQRLESLGVLAGGIAHDFNNLLASILGYAELAQGEVADDTAAAAYLAQVINGGRRAADLVRQLLAYAGGKRPVTQPVNLNRLLMEMHELIHAASGRGIPVQMELAPEELLLEADPTQLHQVVLNLLTNAAEAMDPAAGTIQVRTGRVALTAEKLQRCVIGQHQAPGEYAYLAVVDSGVGMDAVTLARIFDPFFTTKFTGRGLGLAAVQGILRGHRGALHVESALDAGSTFTVYLPLTPTTPVSDAGGRTDSGAAWSPAAVAAIPRDTLLVIDDDPGVRVLAARMLEQLGYDVVLAEHGAAGLALLEVGIPSLRGAIVDLTMPGARGDVVAQQIQALRPGTPIILMSGYGPEEVARQPGAQTGLCFLAKPFTRADLLAALQAALSSAGP